MNRQTINSDTFSKIFADKEDLLANMATSLTRLSYSTFKNNITCNLSNPNNLDYIISMPDDNTIKLINTKTNKKIIYKLKK